MAEVEDIEPEEGSSGGGGGMLKIILVVLLVLLVGVGSVLGTLFFVGFFDEKPEGEQAEEAIAALEEEIEEAENAGGLEPKTLEIDNKFQVSYFSIPDNFTVNVKGSKKVMQVGFSIASHFDHNEMFDEEASALDPNLINGLVPRHMVAIKAAMLKELRSITEDELNKPTGEEQLLENLRMSINAVLERHERLTTDAITEVFITSFVMQ